MDTKKNYQAETHLRNKFETFQIHLPARRPGAQFY